MGISDCAFYISTYIYDIAVEYVDADYGLWLSWLLTPLLITFLLPGFLIILIYTSSVIFHIYKLYRQRLLGDLRGDWREASRQVVSALWDAHGWLWHGYEISGLENIPDEPCLVIYYHGALPVDMYYFISYMYLRRRKLIHTVADRILFKIPGWAIVMDAMCVIPGTVATCAGVLRAGNILAISPGGVYEAQFGEPSYKLCWRNRMGFAKVALDAKVPIVPMFTQNIREAFRTVGWLRGLWLRVYAATHIPLAPVYGGFPVKLISHLGPAIPYDPDISAHDLQRKVAIAIEDLIEKHQRRPSSILRALVERVYRVPKTIEAPKTDVPRANGKLPPECNDSAEGTDVRKCDNVVHRKTVESELQVASESAGDVKKDNTDKKFKVS